MTEGSIEKPKMSVIKGNFLVRSLYITVLEGEREREGKRIYYY